MDADGAEKHVLSNGDPNGSTKIYRHEKTVNISKCVFFFSPLSHTHILLLSLMKWRGQKKQRKKK